MAFERWATSRARHHEYGSRPKPGHAQGTREAIQAALGQKIVCSREACGALIHLQAARRQARRAGRAVIAAGDGCASWHCARGRYCSGRFARRQAAMADAILDGSNTLVLWPRTVAARESLWAVPAKLARKLARQAARRVAK